MSIDERIAKIANKYFPEQKAFTENANGELEEYPDHIRRLIQKDLIEDIKGITDELELKHKQELEEAIKESYRYGQAMVNGKEHPLDQVDINRLLSKYGISISK